MLSEMLPQSREEGGKSRGTAAQPDDLRSSHLPQLPAGSPDSYSGQECHSQVGDAGLAHGSGNGLDGGAERVEELRELPGAFRPPALLHHEAGHGDDIGVEGGAVRHAASVGQETPRSRRRLRTYTRGRDAPLRPLPAPPTPRSAPGADSGRSFCGIGAAPRSEPAAAESQRGGHGPRLLQLRGRLVTAFRPRAWILGGRVWGRALDSIIHVCSLRLGVYCDSTKYSCYKTAPGAETLLDPAAFGSGLLNCAVKPNNTFHCLFDQKNVDTRPSLLNS